MATPRKAGPKGSASSTTEPGELRQALQDVADPAMQRVLGDRQVWAEELGRTDAAPLPWPLANGGPGYVVILRALAEAAVTVVLDSMERDRAGSAPAQNPDDPAFQTILRVVARATTAAEEALVASFGGVRLLGTRDLKTWVRQRAVDEAIRSGLPRAEAFKAAGISKAGAYRALKRGRKRT